jgi:hypothetical protein
MTCAATSVLPYLSESLAIGSAKCKQIAVVAGETFVTSLICPTPGRAPDVPMKALADHRGVSGKSDNQMWCAH